MESVDCVDGGYYFVEDDDHEDDYEVDEADHDDGVCCHDDLYNFGSPGDSLHDGSCDDSGDDSDDIYGDLSDDLEPNAHCCDVYCLQ